MDVGRLLESATDMERHFVAEAAAEPAHPTGWSPALLLFHVSRWRERLGDQLVNLSHGLPVAAPPSDIDRLNAEELPRGAGMSLKEAAENSERSMQKLIDLWAGIGDRPFTWYRANTTGEALVRIGYFHPRNHLAEHFVERGDRPRGYRIYEETAAGLRRADAPRHTLGPALYNLACARAAEARPEEALSLLEEAFPMWPGLRQTAAGDPGLAALREEPRFLTMISGSEGA